MREWITPIVGLLGELGRAIAEVIRARRTGRRGPTARDVLDRHEDWDSRDARRRAHEYMERVRRGDTP